MRVSLKTRLMKFRLIPRRLRCHKPPAPAAQINGRVVAQEVLSANDEVLVKPDTVEAATRKRKQLMVLIRANEVHTTAVLHETDATGVADGTVKVAGEQGADKSRCDEAAKKTACAA